MVDSIHYLVLSMLLATSDSKKIPFIILKKIPFALCFWRV